ncbi:hypothetical protein RM190_08680 [Paracoccus sp. CPCC 101403]|uniref:Terminase small subunit n=1 Tax=Paracoccus broussonetiae TaxID=3075834 RepID=A0ABU3ECH3_9RHOB|nr:hypothetical protein [Paracoccus sp. CPCC 101403]MDT1061928.1 hypothetical protein [Paracoccus sp. CPCC 101403]
MDSENISDIVEKRILLRDKARVSERRKTGGAEYDMLVRATNGMDDPATNEAWATSNRGHGGQPPHGDGQTGGIGANRESEFNDRMDALALRVSELELQSLENAESSDLGGSERGLKDALAWLERVTPVVRRLYWAVKEAAPQFEGPDRTALDQAVGALDAWQSAHSRLHETIAETKARELDP